MAVLEDQVACAAPCLLGHLTEDARDGRVDSHCYRLVEVGTVVEDETAGLGRVLLLGTTGGEEVSSKQ